MADGFSFIPRAHKKPILHCPESIMFSSRPSGRSSVCVRCGVRLTSVSRDTMSPYSVKLATDIAEKVFKVRVKGQGHSEAKCMFRLRDRHGLRAAVRPAIYSVACASRLTYLLL